MTERPGSPLDDQVLANAAALARAGRMNEAIAGLDQSLALAPDRRELRLALAKLQLQAGRHRKAMAILRQGVEHDPELLSLCRDTGQIREAEAQAKVVIENCRHILARYPIYAPAHYGMACALLTLGRVAEARRAAEHALVIDPTVPTYYHVLIHTGDAAQNANALSALRQLACHEDVLDEVDRATLHFLLAKAYDDAKEFDSAFAYLAKGNAVKRAMIQYDEARELARMHAIAQMFTAQRMARLQGAGSSSPLPVFVVGMPRSGTTLVEQILASHGDMHGAGELTTLPDLIAEGYAGADYPAGFDSGTPSSLRGLGDAYVAQVSAIAPKAGRIVDKLPYNFLHAGLIHLALPQARIIHVKRDPLDTCFSCYSLSFSGDVGFAYDLGELGRYYRAYDALMGHWRRVLPEGAMLEIQYEALVDDLPAVARRMVAHCGLDWDERCAEFHNNARAVATASLYQVRQPVYRKSVGRADAYKSHLAPLRTALGLR